MLPAGAGRCAAARGDVAPLTDVDADVYARVDRCSRMLTKVDVSRASRCQQAAASGFACRVVGAGLRAVAGPLGGARSRAPCVRRTALRRAALPMPTNDDVMRRFSRAGAWLGRRPAAERARKADKSLCRTRLLSASTRLLSAFCVRKSREKPMKADESLCYFGNGIGGPGARCHALWPLCGPLPTG